jgi:hypothetical protein
VTHREKKKQLRIQQVSENILFYLLLDKQSHPGIESLNSGIQLHPQTQVGSRLSRNSGNWHRQPGPNNARRQRLSERGISGSSRIGDRWRFNFLTSLGGWPNALLTFTRQQLIVQLLELLPLKKIPQLPAQFWPFTRSHGRVQTLQGGTYLELRSGSRRLMGVRIRGQPRLKRGLW